MTPETYHLPVSLCPCGMPLDGATESGLSGDGAPVPGDYTLCLYCQRMFVFGEGLQLRPMSDEELAEMGPEDRSAMMKAMRVAMLVSR